MNQHWTGFPIWPEQASSVAGRVDALLFFLVAVSAFFAALIMVLIAFFMIKYRRRPGNVSAAPTKTLLALEIAWTVIPLGLVIVMFVWGARLYFSMYNPPAGAMEIFVVGKQWMWKFQHPEGHREINELHVPLNRPVKLLMISEDVIHDLFVPAFRVKRDVLPGRYTMAWFKPTKLGRYHLFCSQYCGTEHSLMTGWVEVMEPTEYQKWLAGNAAAESMVAGGQKLFTQLGCATCHKADGTGRGPSLVGVYGHGIKMQSGETAMATDEYLRTMIVTPGVKVVQGYQPIMPTFKGIVSEEGLLQLIEYIKSLSPEGARK